MKGKDHIYQSIKKTLAAILLLVIIAFPLGGNMAEGAANEHTIQKGDTLWLLSLRYNVKLQDLFEANPGINPYNLLPGQKILLPAQSSNLASGKEE